MGDGEEEGDDHEHELMQEEYDAEVTVRPLELVVERLRAVARLPDAVVPSEGVGRRTSAESNPRLRSRGVGFGPRLWAQGACS